MHPDIDSLDDETATNQKCLLCEENDVLRKANTICEECYTNAGDYLEANAGRISAALDLHAALISCYNELKSKTRVGESEQVLAKCVSALAKFESKN